MTVTLPGRKAPPVVAQHVTCVAELHVAFLCDEGHVVSDPVEVELVDGPGAAAKLPAAG